MNLVDSNILDFIKLNEGFRHHPYRCTSGKLTIGYGTNIEEEGISEKVGGIILEDVVYTCIRDLSGVFGTFHLFSDKRKTALTDMRYNLGLTRFSTFKRMIAAIRAGDWARAAAEAKDSLWYSQVGDRGPRVVRLLREG